MTESAAGASHLEGLRRAAATALRVTTNLFEFGRDDPLTHSDDLNWLRKLVTSWQREGQRIGVVPTMGALHSGHLSLVQAARRDSDRVIVTIFVNPSQFGPGEDLARYPRTLNEDLERLQSEKVDAVFVPSESAIYPPNFSTWVEPPLVARGFEGAQRPTHFRGVTTIVLKLLNLTRADAAYFGQKDFQQVAVIRAMASDLNLACEIVMCPTVREADGLAMSSRNRYLTLDQRPRALGLIRALKIATDRIRSGETQAAVVEELMQAEMRAAGVDSVDYARVCHPRNLEGMERIEFPAILLVAARIGTLRLLDNWWIESP